MHHIFHKFTIKGLTFAGIMSGAGPYIECEQTRKGVPIGFCASFEKHSHPYSDSGYTYFICKYRNQIRVELPCLLDEDISILSKEFGIPVGYRTVDADEYFYASSAYKSLVDWAKQHPRLFARYRHHQDYVLWADIIDQQRHNDLKAT